MTKFLKIFRKKISFLNQISDEIYLSLNVENFMLPNKRINKLRKELEKVLNQYVVTYTLKKVNVKSSQKDLCHYLKQAKLNKKEILILKKYEKLVRNEKVSFCVYQKPLALKRQILMKN